MRRLLTRFLRRQEGIAMPVVIGTLTITTGLAAGTFAVVVEGQHASARDRDSKAALGAAEAGLQMAMLRTTQLKPAANMCLTNSVVAPGTASNDGSATVASECPRWRESIGNGATFTYVVATATSGSCPTLPTAPATPAGLGTSRCITSTGEVNGVKRRLQMRFYFNPPFKPWANAGLVGKHKVEIDNNATITSPVGSNGTVELGANSQIIGKVLIPPPPAKFKPAHNADDPPATEGEEQVAAWTFPEIDWDTPRTEGLGFEGVTGWDPYTRILTLGANDYDDDNPIVLSGGTYHVCGIISDSGNWFTVPEGQVARLYIASPRDNPVCANAAGHEAAGRLITGNDMRFNTTDNKNPQELELYLYGTTDDAEEPADDPDVDINNGTEFYGTIWAPNSTIDLWNNGEIEGAFTGGKILMKNNPEFTYDPDVNNKELPGTATARNQSWFECRRDPSTATDPESGCS